MSYFFTCFLSYLPTYMWSIRPCIPFPPLAQACSLCPIQNSLYIPHTALLRTAPSLLERGNGGEDSTVASLFQSLANSPHKTKPFKQPLLFFGKDSKIITNSKCYLGATLVLSWCYLGATLLLPWCYLGAIFILRLSMTFDW